MSIPIYQSRPGYGRSQTRCCVSLHQSGSYYPRQCGNKIKVTRMYQGETLGFCGIHDPEAFDAKRALLDRKRTEERIEVRRIATAYHAYRTAMLMIARGEGPDPREFAKSMLKMNGDWNEEGS